MKKVLALTAFLALSSQAKMVDLGFLDEQDSVAYSGNAKFIFLGKDARIQITTELLRNIKSNYALLPFKEKVVGINFREIAAQALAREAAIEELPQLEANAVAQAKSNNDFYDRLIELIAKFKDTHFGVGTNLDRPIIYNGVRFLEIEKKIVVATIDPRIIKYLSQVAGEDFKKIQPGDEVLEIDGVGIEAVIKERMEKESASSEGFARLSALTNLTIRNDFYPEKNYSIIKFKNAGTFRMPWIYTVSELENKQKKDAQTYLDQKNFISDEMFNTVRDNETGEFKHLNAFEQYRGYRLNGIGGFIRDLNEYYSPSNKTQFIPELRTGYVHMNGFVAGYLQLNTFMLSTLRQKGQDASQAKPAMKVIKAFIQELKRDKIDLILDLRNNGGGYANLPGQLLALLTETGKVYGTGTSSLRVAPNARLIIEGQFALPLMAADLTQSESDMVEMLSELDAAIFNKSDYLPMFNDGFVKTKLFDPKIVEESEEASNEDNGYNGRIVALISPNCISACDKMSYMLKQSKRAVLIGTHSNGTGAGFSSNGTVGAEWTDSLQVMSTRLPNHVFGLAGDDIYKRVYEKDSVLKLCTENRPTVADVEYSTTMTDFKTGNKGWILAALKSIAGQKPREIILPAKPAAAAGDDKAKTDAKTSAEVEIEGKYSEE